MFPQSFFQDTFYLQRILKFAGYDCGHIDGIRGIKTNKALENWLLDCDKYKKQYGTLDERTEKNLESLLPSVQKIFRVWYADKVKAWQEKNGVTVKIICGTRTIKEQNELYAIGRTKAGKKVTNAKGGSSFHNYGIAFDIGIFQGKEYLTADDFYKKLVEDCGTPDEMLNGGSWQIFKDYPHFEVAKYCSKSSNVRKIWNKL